MTYAFTFDATFCSGCKACQAACKDKNDLPTGLLWRRVVEVSGGTWQKNGDAWNNSVFAYNLSLSCNHCVHPKCAGVCPVDAFILRGDGIVILDTAKCVGCGYCGWACPYGAPQYNSHAGHMTKCDFCLDHLEQGLPPACVAACPMRVLDYCEGTLPERGLPLWETPSENHPYPLPHHSHTQPRLVILPHPAMNTIEKKAVANLEEVQPRPPSSWEDLPLILFTLLGQMAVGSFWSMTWMFLPLWSLLDKESAWLRLLPLAFVGTSLGMGLLTSFAHLGTKKNAWRVWRHWRKSSLSREVLFSGLFGMSWLFTTLESGLRHAVTFETMAVTAILGIGLVYSMSQVYRLPAIPAWDTWRTNAGFMVSALLLGQSAMAALLVYEAGILGIQLPSSHWIISGSSILILLLVQIFLTREQPVLRRYRDIRMGLILTGMVLTVAALLFSHSAGAWISLLVFLFVVMEEGIGRWLFYRSRT